MMVSEQDRLISMLLKISGVVAFVADCLAIYLFIRELVRGQPLSVPTERTVTLAIVIVLAFVLALALIHFSGKQSDGLFVLFGVIYAVYGAVFLGLASHLAIRGVAAELSELRDHAIMVIALSVLCWIVMGKVALNMKWAALPYILASIFHIALTLLVVATRGQVPMLSHLFLLLGMAVVTAFLVRAREASY